MKTEQERVFRFVMAVSALFGVLMGAWMALPEFNYQERYQETLDLAKKLYEKFGDELRIYPVCFFLLVACFLGIAKWRFGIAYHEIIDANTWLSAEIGEFIRDVLIIFTDLEESQIIFFITILYWSLIYLGLLFIHGFPLYKIYRFIRWYVVEGLWVYNYYRRKRKSGPKDGKSSVIIPVFVHFDSPLEIFEVTTFDVLGFELNETYAFTFFSLLSAFTIGNLVVGESTIEEEEDEDFEDEDFTMDATDSLITDNLGDNDDEELDTIIQTIFQSVLFSNLANLIPFGDSNSNYLIFTLYLAGTCFLALNFNGFLIHTFNMIQLFLPQGVPSFLRPLLFVIEFISYFARLFSLGIRLFANMLSGHILMAILSTFAVILLVGLNFGSFASIVLLIIITCIFFLETIISYLQAYVFGMLVTIYYGDALNLHH